MKNNHERGFITWLLTLVVALIVVGGGVYLYNQKSPEPARIILDEKPAPTLPTPDNSFRTASSSDETVSWKTYRNEKYGFEFKYPPTLVQEIVDLKSLNISDQCLLFGNYDTQSNLDRIAHTDGDATGVMDFCVAESKVLAEDTSQSLGRVVIPLDGIYSIKINDGTYGMSSTFPLVIKSFHTFSPI